MLVKVATRLMSAAKMAMKPLLSLSHICVVKITAAKFSSNISTLVSAVSKKSLSILNLFMSTAQKYKNGANKCERTNKYAYLCENFMDSIIGILSSTPFFYVALVVGIALLVYAGDWVVKSSVWVAEYFNVSKLIIGVTIVSMGTSLPELCVSINAALNGSANIAIGNVVGSNIANVCLILGITAVIITLPISRSVIRRDLMILLAATLLFAFSLIDNEINMLEGIFMLLLMVLYMYLTFKSAKKESQQSPPETEKEPEKKHNIWISILLVIVSCAGLIAGSELLVYGAENIARSLGVSERVIAVTVVAIGTSLPELTTSIVAAIKKELDISVGNIIGSNIFNICMIIGLTSCVTTLEAEPTILSFDVWFLLASILLLGITVFPIKGRTEIVRIEGIMLLLLYIGYYVAMGVMGQFAAL